MPEPIVSSTILSILEAFRKGSELFRRSPRRSKRRHVKDEASNEEQHIDESLTLRPKEIRKTYEHSVAQYGKAFEQGDAISHAGLATILMNLNLGLLRLIDQCLYGEQSTSSRSRKSLLTLSESAAADTLSALTELNKRVVMASKLSLPLQLRGGCLQDMTPDRRAATGQRLEKQSPAQNPRLANGGWVRSKSDPSVVSIVTAPRAGQAKRPQHGRRPSAEKVQRGRNSPSTPADLSQRASPVQAKVVAVAHPDTAASVKDNSRDEVKQSMHRPVSMLLVPADMFTQSFEPHTEQQQSTTMERPPRPPKIPLESKPQMIGSAMRPRPPSMMTFVTASTKLGEIPEHKWPSRVLTEEEKVTVPMPYVVPAMLNPPRKKGRGFKFWKKQTHMQAIAA